MAKTLTPPEALHRAAALCSSSEHCIDDIRQKLTRWGIGTTDTQTIIERLVHERFIDEERYAIAFVRDKFRFACWGRIKMSYALQQKRIPGHLIAHALSHINNELYTTRLTALLQEKSRSITDENPETRRAKLFRFAASRGFESDLIFKAIKEILP